MAYWEKRAQFVSFYNTKSVLDKQDPNYLKIMLSGDSKSVDEYKLQKQRELSATRVSMNQVEVRLEQSNRNEKLSTSVLNPQTLSKEKSVDVTKTIVDDITKGCIDTRKQKKRARRLEEKNDLSRSTTPNSIMSFDFSQNSFTLQTSPAMTDRSSETGTILSHPINLFVTKLSFLLTCIFKPRLESMGISVDDVNFSS